MKIHFREGAVPEAVYTPAKVPFHYKEATEELLQNDVALGVIEKVHTNGLGLRHGHVKEEKRQNAQNH